MIPGVPKSLVRQTEHSMSLVVASEFLQSQIYLMDIVELFFIYIPVKIDDRSSERPSVTVEALL